MYCQLLNNLRKCEVFIKKYIISFIQGPVIINVEGGREKKKGQGYFRLARRGLNFFIKKFGGICSLIARYINFKRAPLAKLGKVCRVQTICVKQ